MDHVIYLQHNGEIVRGFSGPAADVECQLSPGEAAVPGAGTWLTHRVEDGRIAALPERRCPPFEGAAWDSSAAAWFDPLHRTETAGRARVQRRALLVAKIEQAELRQARPLREIQVALALVSTAPGQAIASLQAIELEIALLRAQLAALA